MDSITQNEEQAMILNCIVGDTLERLQITG